MQAAAERAATDAAEVDRIAGLRTAAQERLPHEPPSSTPEPVLTAMFQLPDGTRPRRRFLLSTPVDTVFDFVDSVGGGGVRPESYRLVTRFPRRVLSKGSGLDLARAQVSAGQMVFVVEEVQEATEGARAA
jgi:hypothetical protein